MVFLHERRHELLTFPYRPLLCRGCFVCRLIRWQCVHHIVLCQGLADSKVQARTSLSHLPKLSTCTVIRTQHMPHSNMLTWAIKNTFMPCGTQWLVSLFSLLHQSVSRLICVYDTSTNHAWLYVKESNSQLLLCPMMGSQKEQQYITVPQTRPLMTKQVATAAESVPG